MDESAKVFNWDDEIEKDDQFVTLEEGDYDFTVTNFERGLQDKTEKLPQCPKAIIALKVGDATITENFALCGAMEWKISAFFRAIGMKKHGEKLRMDWQGSIGKTGRCHVIKSPGTKNNNAIFNNVSKYYDYVPTKPAGDDTWS